ncbi:MAG TPA: recombinase family protein, partial [Casimicrobiaceae bacterium]|nr:recombinase family protein [Casimicrobiaceae bacterium]
GMAVRLIVQSPGVASTRGADPKLVAVVARAHEWLARLTSGRCNSVQAIANEEQVSSSYVTRVIYLAFLAPDIVQRIIRGDHPIELNAARLMRAVPLPLHWGEQRARLGLVT